MAPLLAIVVPCYDEEEVLPVTLPLFLNKLDELILAGLAAPNSRPLFVDDGSRDSTWELICEAATNDARVTGITLSRNRGHQNALFAGLMEALIFCDVSISIDADGQDDLDAMDKMLRRYSEGDDIVYGVRDDRSTDTRFKRFTAQTYYRLLNLMGVHAIFNAADYRLMSKKALEALASYSEVNLFLRGIVPHLGLSASEVTYARRERLEGKSHYPLQKMLRLAFDGITSFSVRPIRLIIAFGFLVSLLSLALIVWALGVHFAGRTVPGWSSNLVLIAFFGGLQILAIGIIGEYIGKIYLETKERPRYFIANRVGFDKSE